MGDVLVFWLLEFVGAHSDISVTNCINSRDMTILMHTILGLF